MPIRPLSEDIKLGKKKISITNTYDCPVCNAQSEAGTPLRLKADRMLVADDIEGAISYLRGFHIIVTQKEMLIHLNKHSSYIEEAKQTILAAAKNVALSRIDKLEAEYIDADDVIQEIITIGGNKIRAEEIKVDSRLLMGALKEQGTRKKMGSLQQMFTELDKSRFQVGVVEGEVEKEELLAPITDEKKDGITRII